MSNSYETRYLNRYGYFAKNVQRLKPRLVLFYCQNNRAQWQILLVLLYLAILGQGIVCRNFLSKGSSTKYVQMQELINDSRSHVISIVCNEVEGPFPTTMYSIRFITTITTAPVLVLSCFQ